MQATISQVYYLQIIQYKAVAYSLVARTFSFPSVNLGANDL